MGSYIDFCAEILCGTARLALCRESSYLACKMETSGQRTRHRARIVFSAGRKDRTSILLGPFLCRPTGGLKSPADFDTARRCIKPTQWQRQHCGQWLTLALCHFKAHKIRSTDFVCCVCHTWPREFSSCLQTRCRFTALLATF